MKRLQRNRHVLVMREQSSIRGRKIVERGGFESAEFRKIGEEQRRQSRGAGSKQLSFGCIPSRFGHRAGVAKGRRDRAVAVGCSSTVAIKWWAKWHRAGGERVSATFWASRRCSSTSCIAFVNAPAPSNRLRICAKTTGV